MRSILSFSIVICVLSFILGWYQANTGLSKLSSQSDGWGRIYDEVALEFNVENLAKTLKTRTLFPNGIEEEVVMENGLQVSQDGEGEAPEFPPIVSAGYRDGEPLVVLLKDDNSLFSVVPGDILENGWQIEAIDLNTIFAVFEGEKQEFSVVQYDLSDGAEVLKEGEGN